MVEQHETTGLLSREQLQEWAKSRQERKKTVNVQEEKLRIILFRLSDTWFAFRGSDVKEVIEVGTRPVTLVPGSPDFVLGVINLRGIIESLVDPYRLLGVHRVAELPPRHAVIIHQGDLRTGFCVDAVEEVVDIPVSALDNGTELAIDNALRELIAASIPFRGRPVAILNTARLFQRIVQ
ncbi:MAG: chemotaxis protein CheW [Magnetococcus sp. DMHC-8]